MMQPGRLNRRLVLEAPTEEDDGAGGVVRDFQSAALLWASIEPLSARAALSADAPGAVVSHRIIVRRRMGITTRHRLREGERIFDIVSLSESGRGFLDIRAQERVD